MRSQQEIARQQAQAIRNFVKMEAEKVNESTVTRRNTQDTLTGVDKLIDQFVDQGFQTCVSIVAKADF